MELAKTALNIGVVLISDGLNKGILLYSNCLDYVISMILFVQSLLMDK